MYTLGRSLQVHDVVEFPSLCIWCAYVLTRLTEDSTRKDEKANNKVQLVTGREQQGRTTDDKEGNSMNRQLLIGNSTKWQGTAESSTE